jgi:hypothetical protein
MLDPQVTSYQPEFTAFEYNTGEARNRYRRRRHWWRLLQLLSRRRRQRLGDLRGGKEGGARSGVDRMWKGSSNRTATMQTLISFVHRCFFKNKGTDLRTGGC